MRNRQRQRGFIIFFGWRGVKGNDGSPSVQMVCPLCREQSVLHGRVIRRWFTLFFIPVLPLQSVAGGYRFTQCSTCKREIDRTTDQLRQMVVAPATADHQTAIRLYNELRDSPEDAGKLLDLVRVYLRSGELHDAQTACRMFPVAYGKDPAIEQALRAAGG
jgi:hypothetical protein